MNFANVKQISIPEGDVKRITTGGTVLWQAYDILSEGLVLNGYYIDTGVKVISGSDTILELDLVANNPELPRTSNYICAGLYNVVSAGTWFGGSTISTWTIGSSYYSNVSITQRSVCRIRYNRTNRRQYLTVNDTSVSGYQTWTSSVDSNFNNRNLVFGKIRPTTFAIKVYACKIYTNGELVKDLVPVYRKSDGVNCMYDNISESYIVPILSTL